MTATVRRVTPPPQHKGIVPPAHESKLLAARRAKDDAEEAYRTAVADALKAGGSVREVMRITGLSNQTVDRWGKERGWPTAAQVRAREEVRERNRAFRAWAAGTETPGDPPPPAETS